MPVDSYYAVRSHLDGTTVELPSGARTFRAPSAELDDTRHIPIFYDEMPSTSVYALVLLGRRGSRPNYGLGGDVTHRWPIVDVMTFAPTAGEGRTLAMRVRERMDELRGSTFASEDHTSTVTSATQDSQPELLERTDALAALHHAGAFRLMMAP